MFLTSSHYKTIFFVSLFITIILIWFNYPYNKKYNYDENKTIIMPKINYIIKNDNIDVEATAFLAKETNSSNIIYAKNIHKELSPASLTKVMTAVIVIERANLNDIVTIPPNVVFIEPFKFGAEVGDKFTLKSLLIAMLVSSSNDAATSIAVHMAGSEKEFAKLMNKKAKELNMENTIFTNSCGFDNGENISTAFDLMLLTQYAIKLPYFNDIVNYKEFTITNIDNSKYYNIKTHNKLFKYYPNAVGIKTGYTQKAGPCLIARSKENKKDILLIILNSARGKRWEISKRYFEKL